MPCWACTTGSPARSSDRSRTMASTLLARSWSRLPRRPVVASPGYRSFSVRKARPAPGRPKPADSGAAAMPKCASEDRKASMLSGWASGVTPNSLSICTSVSRRPAESAHSSRRLWRPWTSARSGDRILGAARHADVGRGAEIGCGWPAVSARRRKSFSLPCSVSGSRNSADGGSTGRSRSLLRKPYRLAVSWPKRCMASSMSPTVTVTVSSAR